MSSVISVEMNRRIKDFHSKVNEEAERIFSTSSSSTGEDDYSRQEAQTSYSFPGDEGKGSVHRATTGPRIIRDRSGAHNDADDDQDINAPAKHESEYDITRSGGHYKTDGRAEGDDRTTRSENSVGRARVIQRQREVAVRRMQNRSHPTKMVMRKADGPMASSLLSAPYSGGVRAAAGTTSNHHHHQRTSSTMCHFSAPRLVVDQTSNGLYSTTDNGGVGDVFQKGDTFDKENVPERGRKTSLEGYDERNQGQQLFPNQPNGKMIATSDKNMSVVISAGGGRDSYEHDPYEMETNQSVCVTKRQDRNVQSNDRRAIEPNIGPHYDRPHPSGAAEEGMDSQRGKSGDQETLYCSKSIRAEGYNDQQHPQKFKENCSIRSDEDLQAHAPKKYNNQTGDKGLRRTDFKRSSSNLYSLVSDRETKVSEVEEDHRKENYSAYTENPDKTADESPFIALDGHKLSDPNTMRAFLMSPCPKRAGVIQCYVKRNRSGANKLFPEYSVFLKDGDIFLMTSRKRTNSKTSNYLISMEQNDHGRDSDFILGKLRSNFLGTEFQIYDGGISPAEYHQDIGGTGNEIVGLRSELGAIIFESNVIRSRGPRKMQVCIAKLDDNDVPLRKWQPLDKEGEMLSDFKKAKDDVDGRRVEKSNLLVFGNRPPQWNEKLGAYSLNFNGRVTMASVKNFQLVEPHNDDNIILQFGRVARDEFTMDCRWPMSPFQAFAIALSSFDSKIACE